MKKIVFMLLLFGAALFANPSTPYVYRVYNSDYKAYDYLYYEQYQDILMDVTTPKGPTYISQRFVKYNETKYIHPLGSRYSIYIDVYFPATTPSGSAIFIWERNQYEAVNHLNDRLIQGYAASQYKTYQVDFTDGSKLVRYLVPDMSPYHKEITIATRPNMKSQSDAYCAYTVTDIAGSLNYTK